MTDKPTPEETAKLIVEEFNGHTFFMESMAQEWLAKRIAEGITKHVAADRLANVPPPFAPNWAHPLPKCEEAPEDDSNAIKLGPFDIMPSFSSEQGKKYEVTIKDGKIVSAKEITAPKPAPKKRSGPNWG